MSTKYEGRVVTVTKYLNTDRDAQEIVKSLYPVARGPNEDAQVMIVQIYEGDAGKELWEKLRAVAVEVATNPDSEEF